MENWKFDMPEEHESIFSRFYGTDKWKENIMFRTTSDEKIVTVEGSNGQRFTSIAHTNDRKWVINHFTLIDKDARVVCYMDFPEPYAG